MNYRSIIILTVMALVLTVSSASAITADTGDNPAQEKALINNSNENVAYKLSVEERHIREVNRPPGPHRDDRGGPDDMGYEWRDNLEDDGPEFEWIDLNQFNNVQYFRMGDDQNTGALQLGWTFPFWDRAFDCVNIDTDAWMSFTYRVPRYLLPADLYPMPADIRWPENVICLQSIDYYRSTDVWFWTNGEDMAVIWWAGGCWREYPDYFQLILHGNGLAVMQYGENTSSHHVGVNLGDGLHGWYMGNDIGPGRAIAFGPSAALEDMADDPEDLINQLIAEVDALPTPPLSDDEREELKQFLFDALNYLAQFDPDDPNDGVNDAIDKLVDFIDKVNDRIVDGDLTQDQGDYLIELANAIIDLLSGNGDASDPGIALTIQAPVPSAHYLSQNYPNPFNAVTRLSYGLPDAARVSIRVYDISGDFVSTLVDDEQAAGKYTAVWDGRGSPAGVYLVRMEATNFNVIRKAILLR